MMPSSYVYILLFKVGLELKVFSFLLSLLTYCFVEDFNCTELALDLRLFWALKSLKWEK